MKPRRGAADSSQRDSFVSVQAPPEDQTWSAMRRDESGAAGDDRLEKRSEGQHSAVSFANPAAFEAERSRAGSRGESIGQDDIASQVSFAAIKRRRGRPERCRRRRRGEEKQESDVTESSPDSPRHSVPQDLDSAPFEPVLITNVDEPTPPSKDISPEFRISVKKVNPKLTGDSFDNKLCDDMGAEDEATADVKVAPFPEVNETVVIPITAHKLPEPLVEQQE